MKFEIESGAALGLRTKIRCVAEQLCEWHFGLNHLGTRSGLQRNDFSTSTGDVAHDPTRVHFGGLNLEPHERFEKSRLRSLCSRLKSQTSCYPEGRLG